MFTVRAQGTRAPWSTIEHVRFENNVVRHSGSAINILGYDDTAPSQQARDIVIRNNLFTDIDHRNWGGAGIFVQIGDEPADVHIEHNTVMQSGNIISVYGGTAAAPRRGDPASASPATSSCTTPTASSATASAPATRRSPPTSRRA